MLSAPLTSRAITGAWLPSLLAALELGERVDGDAAAAGGLGEDDRERPQRARDRPALQPLAAHGRDQGGDVVAADLVEPAAAEPGDRVGLRPLPPKSR
jgi:hypothetical protein